MPNSLRWDAMAIMEPDWWHAEGPDGREFAIHRNWDENELILSTDFNDETPTPENYKTVWGDQVALMTDNPELAQIRAETILKLKNLI